MTPFPGLTMNNQLAKRSSKITVMGSLGYGGHIERLN